MPLYGFVLYIFQKDVCKMENRLSYLCSPLLNPYVYQSVPDRLRILAMENPLKEAFVFYTMDGERQFVTRGELYQTSISLGKHFIKLGMRKGSMIGVCMNNSMNMLFVNFGIALAGAIPFFLATNLRDGSDIIDTMNEMKSEFLIIDSNESDENWNILENIWPAGSLSSSKIPSLKQIICNGRISNTRSSKLELSDLLKAAHQEDIELPTVYPEDILLCFCTSGSTGKPKVVMVSHFSALNYTLHCNIYKNITDEIVYLCDRQFSWPVGYPRAYLARGCTRVFLDTRVTLSGKYIDLVCDIIEKEKVKVAYVPGYLAVDLIRNEQYMPKFKQVQLMIASGERFNTEFVKLKDGFCKQLASWYGNTEAGSQFSFQSDMAEEYEEGIIGTPHPGVEVKIVDDKGTVVPYGDSGEMYVRVAWRLSGYKNSPGLFHEVVDSQGWFHSGDIAHIRPDGNIVIEGRNKELVSIQGLKYFPWAIEKYLKKCAGVKHAIATGVLDVRLGQAICACVVPAENVNFSVDVLKQFCDDTFLEETTAFGISLKPKYYLVLDELPLTSTGKTNRRGINDIARERLGL